jgi:hypothetical protein
MSLFNRPLSVKSSIVLKKGDKQGRDTVLVGKKLWRILVPPDGPGCVCLSIQSLRKPFANDSTTLDALTSWAVLDDEACD